MSLYINSIYSQEQKNLKDIKSKSTRAAVAAIDFGTTYSGFAFSWKFDWSKVQVIENCSGNFLSMKVPTSLLLNPNKTFAAFGLQADINYTEMAEKNDSDSDSDSENNGEKKPNEDYKKYYYFHRFKMLLHENKVHAMLKCICILRKFDNYCKYKGKSIYMQYKCKYQFTLIKKKTYLFFVFRNCTEI